MDEPCVYMSISWHSTDEEQRRYDEEGASTPLCRDCRAGQAVQKGRRCEDLQGEEEGVLAK